jgi:hypothetical protein
MYCHQITYEDESPFWMVWNPAGHAPVEKHPSELAAKAEAERLACLNPGQKFHVLENKGVCAFRTAQWTPVNPDWVPF